MADDYYRFGTSDRAFVYSVPKNSGFPITEIQHHHNGDMVVIEIPDLPALGEVAGMYFVRWGRESRGGGNYDDVYRAFPLLRLD